MKLSQLKPGTAFRFYQEEPFDFVKVDVRFRDEAFDAHRFMPNFYGIRREDIHCFHLTNESFTRFIYEDSEVFTQ